MDVNEAVVRSKQYIQQIFGGEGISNIGLEEVEFDDARGTWLVTVGFSRPWDQPHSLTAILGEQLRRSYKIVTIKDDNGDVLSVKNREVGA